MTPDEVELTDDAIREAVQHWQRRELSRFGAHLPAILQPLAAELSFQPKELDAREQAMVEDGWWSGGAHWVSHTSPVSSEELQAKDASSAIEYVVTWKAPDDRDSEDSHGLLHAFRTAVIANSQWGEEVAREALRTSAPLRVKTAVLEGLRDIVRARVQAADDELQTDAAQIVFPWVTCFEMVDDAFTEAEKAGEKANDQQLRAYLDAGIDVLLLTSSGSTLVDVADRVWDLLERGRKQKAIWAFGSATAISDIEGVLIASLNTLSGQLVRATINVGLGQARLWREKTGESGGSVPEDISRKVGLALDEFLHTAMASRSGSTPSAGGYGALGMMGEYVPQIGYLAPNWLSANIAALFVHEDDPMLGPAWAAYITRAVFSEKVFGLARQHYLNAIRASSPDDEKKGRWSTSEGLAQHVLISVLRGVSVLEPVVDKIVEETFSRVSAQSRAHACWEIYRGWEDHDGPISDILITRLVAFWAWRLKKLEAAEDSDDRAEEAEGLLWFFLTPRVPANLSLDLALRTVKLLGKRVTANLTLFERLAATAEEFPERTYEVAEVAVSLSLASEYRYVPKEPLSVVFKAALASDNAEIRNRAEHIVDRLLEETNEPVFADLLRSRQGAPARER